MPTNSSIWDEGKARGKEAFAEGIKCAPALDPKMAALITGKNTKEVIELLSGWHGGWAEACIAEPVAFEEEMKRG